MVKNYKNNDISLNNGDLRGISTKIIENREELICY